MHGATYEVRMKFEADLNRKRKRKNLRIKMAFIPVFRDEIIPALLDGRGDIAAAGTSPLTGIDDLQGKNIYVRKSSSYSLLRDFPWRHGFPPD